MTFIIEGFEIPALLGAKNHIRDDFPKLAVCTYHVVSDMWEIPRLIDTIHPGYRFYFRHYDFPNNWETVLYAIPPKQKAKRKTKQNRRTREQSKRKRIVSVSFDEGWSNAQITKDCGLVPYLLYKNHHCRAKMVGGHRDSDYSNLKYVKGMDVDFLPNGSLQAKMDYLNANASKIDWLLLFGCYESNLTLADIYKARNPKGKIYLALDANPPWMDRIPWKTPNIQKFMGQCDLIATSGRAVQKHLNEKLPWPVEYIPNGFYNFLSKPWHVNFEQKENIILTVGRLGTEQKATHVLLEAFAQIAEAIPDWELRLIGSIEPGFHAFIEQFWIRFPDLKNRVHFLGSVMDRECLYEEYLRAKIFALTSILEGGTPNVIAEALYAGNVVATTKIAEYQDATDDGRCGLAAEIDDIQGFSEILLRLCKSENLDSMCRHAFSYAQEEYDMEKIVARLYCMLWGEEDLES